MFDENDINNFQASYKKYFKVSISSEDAEKKLYQLVKQVEIIYRPITQSEYEKYVNENGKEIDFHENGYGKNL